MNHWECDQLGKKRLSQSKFNKEVHSYILTSVGIPFLSEFITGPPAVCGSLKPTVAHPTVSLCAQQKMVHRDARCVLQRKDKMTSV